MFSQAEFSPLFELSSYTHLGSSVASVSHLSLKFDLRHRRFIITRQNFTLASFRMLRSSHIPWRDVNKIISTCEPLVTPEVLGQMERILTTGCPSYFNWEEDTDNKHAFVSRRNLPSVAQHVAKTLMKEVRNSHLIPMAQWVCTCSPCGRHVPENIQFKPRKKPRLIWNCSTCMF